MADGTNTFQNSFTTDNIRAERERQNQILMEKMAAEMPAARGRLSDRGIDPNPVVATDYQGRPMTVAGFYMMLRGSSVTEKAGQDPTYRAARLAIKSDLPGEVRDAAFIALNQQSAEEASHGDKVFGAAYYTMGGLAPATVPEDMLDQGA